MDDFWVFGYGSLIWKPGFDFLERQRALIQGYHRSLCVYSHVHRGTPETPGLVLGLDARGSCHGIAFRVAGAKRVATLDYLRAREQVTSVYREIERPVILSGNGRRVPAVTYVADRAHAQYAGRLPLETQKRYVLQGHGVSGACIDYVRASHRHFAEAGIPDSELGGLLALIDEPETRAA